MTQLVHPSKALFVGEKPFPVIPSCEHFAGSEKLIGKALELQDKLGPVFDITCDCEDGAPAGQEKAHAEMIVKLLTSEANKYKMAGARIHDHSHPLWKQDVDILVAGAGRVLAYITIPKCTTFDEGEEMIAYIETISRKALIGREIPIHILVETHGALRDAQRLAALPNVQVLDFGLMDFVSGHHGAIPASAMRSPGQFEHHLLVRAKTEVVAAALACGVVPAHNVCLDLKNTEVVMADAKRARYEFGFLRVWSIYPTQITAIVDAMKPDLSEVEDAANILLAAQAADWGPIQYKGELHDRATYRYFWEILQKANVTGVKILDSANRAFFS
ncbi:MAG: CoA ester lyase [Burkholderiales bacterium]|nr:CoA ester lyase [Burkholderiales bacterium]